jgi:hypothetical protein
MNRFFSISQGFVTDWQEVAVVVAVLTVALGGVWVIF